MVSLILTVVLLGNTHIHGTVVDGTNKAVVGAVVRLLHVNEGGVTDHHGQFHIHYNVDDAGENGLVHDSVYATVQRLGFETDTVLLSINAMNRIIIVRADYQTNPILVVANAERGRSTQTVRTLTQEELNENRGATIADALTMIPGVTALRSGASVSKPMIHGVTGQRVTLSNNGVDQQGQQWGEDHGPEIDPFTPMSLTLIKGPSSVEYGPGAMGGVIAIEPPSIAEDSLAHGSISTNLYSNNLQASAGMQLEKNKVAGLPLAVRGFGAIRRAGNSHAPTYTLGNTAFEQHSAGVFTVLGAPSAGPTASIYATYFSANLGVLSSSHVGNISDLYNAMQSDTPLVSDGSFYDIRQPKQEINHLLLSVKTHVPISGVGLLNLTYGWQQNDRNEYDRHNSRVVGHGVDSTSRAADSSRRLSVVLSTPALSLRLTTYNASVDLVHKPIGKMNGGIGVSGMRQVNSRGGKVTLIPDYELHGIGAFIHESFLFSNRLELDAGLRFDSRWMLVWPGGTEGDASVLQTRSWSSMSGGIGMRWIHSDAYSSSANIGLAWRPPQVNELYSNGVHHGAAQYEIGDSLLGIEQMVGAEYTFALNTSDFSTILTAYANYYNGFIQAIPQPHTPTITVRGTFPTFRYLGTNALIAGIDVESKYNFSTKMSLLFRGMFLFGQNATSGTYLYRMPPPRVRMALHYHDHDVLGIEDFYAEVGCTVVSHQWRYVTNQDYLAPPPGYSLVDLRVGGAMSLLGMQSTWSLTTTNILNMRYRDYLSRYRYYADDTGTDIVLRVSVPFQL